MHVEPGFPGRGADCEKQAWFVAQSMGFGLRVATRSTSFLGTNLPHWGTVHSAVLGGVVAQGAHRGP